MIRISRVMALLGLILCGSPAAQAQRVNFSIGLPSASSPSPAQASPSPAPVPMPPPSPLPSFSTDSISLRLQRLNLVSLGVAPPVHMFLYGNGLRPILPQLPFALDPIAQRSQVSRILEEPRMCVDRR